MDGCTKVAMSADGVELAKWLQRNHATDEARSKEAAWNASHSADEQLGIADQSGAGSSAQPIAQSGGDAAAVPASGAGSAAGASAPAGDADPAAAMAAPSMRPFALDGGSAPMVVAAPSPMRPDLGQRTPPSLQALFQGVRKVY